MLELFAEGFANLKIKMKNLIFLWSSNYFTLNYSSYAISINISESYFSHSLSEIFSSSLSDTLLVAPNLFSSAISECVKRCAETSRLPTTNEKVFLFR